jgi:transcription-repair coupling factor (superfamily II helicase)
MGLRGLLDVVFADPALAQVRHRATGLAGAAPLADSVDLTAPPAFRSLVVAGLAAHRPVLAVTSTSREAQDLSAALTCFLAPETVVDFPAWETLPHERLSPSSDTVGQRLSVLRRLRHPDEFAEPIRVIVAPVRAVLQPLVRGLGDLSPVRLLIGDELPRDELVHRLVDAAYSRTDLVEKRGQFAVRGGIVDVFPPTEEHPVRIEFWGDTVEEIRRFKVADQRSLEVVDEGLWAPPCRELILSDTVRERARTLASTHPELTDLLSKIAEGTAVEGMEALSPVLADGMELLLDVIPPESIILLNDPERIRGRAHDLVATSQEFLEASWHNAAAGNVTPIDLGAAAYKSVSEIRHYAQERGLPWWSISPFQSGAEDERIDVDGEFVVDAALATSYRGDTQQVFADVRQWLAKGWSVVLTTEGHGPAERLVESFNGEDIPARLHEDLAQVPEPHIVHVVTGSLDHGFVSESLRLAVLTETDVAGQRSTTKDMRRMPSRRRNQVDPLSLRTGDFVVHEQHGVGRYVEMTQRTVQGATREYLVIEYASSKRGQPGDRLYVPMDQLQDVTRYVGGESPTLHRLGGADWQKAKGRARKAVREIAGELIRLYAARQASKGYAFAPDTPWQRELEDAFPYVETPDQLSTIDEVKRDMERVVPMDRLVCGDVGYGKTEIAVRAAFKAVQDGKQVAVLVPTTLLVQQHFSTFSERYSPFPVKVGALSRFQTDKEAAQVLASLADGVIDVVIGTHRLLSAEVRFKDLGLVIVDEEQRFGVEHKEHLKAMRTNVDVLSMSATPIPRTLEMAVTGIREMSTITTPPEERHPVLTYVGPYDDKQISAAIRREMMREGQVFFVHNRVESIERVASRIRDLVPEARVVTAHGQMNEHALEQVIIDFWDRKFDVLVSTTIVESGLDIPNANTLIVDRADVFGLSQLHQLRGRVGRGRDRAYAYFMYQPERPMTETAHDRLATIAQNTDLGSGMRVAMKDLEIRGAGNLLGGEQSGHIADVGFDLYIRLVGEAVAEYRGDGGPQESPEIRVELPIDAHVPHAYVPEERLRLEAYKRLAAATNEVEINAVAEELLDRYGQMPAPVENLLAVARFRVLARTVGLTDVVLQGASIRFAPVALPESRVMRLTRLHPGTVVKPATRTILVPRPATARVGGQPLRDLDLLAWASDLIRAVLIEQPVGDSSNARA